MEKLSRPSKNILYGHTTQETAKKVEGYPWGFKLKTSIHYWVETTKHGDRFCHYTIDPRNGRKCAPKKDVYHTFVYMYINDEGHVKFSAFTFNVLLRDLRARVKEFTDIINPEQVSELQRSNVLKEITAVVALSITYAKKEYTPERYELLKAWSKETVKYLTTCDLKELANFPEMPEPDIKD